MSLHQCDQHVLVHIAYSLDCASIASLRLTSRELHRLLSCDALWRVVFLRQWPCSVSEVVTRVAPTSWLAEVSTRGALMRALRTNAMGTLQSPAWGTLIAICDTPAHRATVRRHIATGVSRHGAACWDADTLHVQSRRFLARCFQGCGSGEDSEDSTNLAKTLLKTLRWCNDQFVSLDESVDLQPCAMLHFVSDVRVDALWARRARQLPADGVERSWTGFYKERLVLHEHAPMRMKLRATMQPDGMVAIHATGVDSVNHFTLDGYIGPLASGAHGGTLRKVYPSFFWVYQAWSVDGYLVGFWHGAYDAFGGAFIMWPDE